MLLNPVNKSKFRPLSRVIIFALVFSWVFSGWPRIGNFPPGIEEVLAAEITVDSTVSTTSTSHLGSSPTTVFTTESIGYTFYVDSTNYCVYSKTANGGTSWGTAVNVYNAAATCVGIAVWYDRWTPGDNTGNLIHIALINTTDSDIFYRNLDTSNDTLSADGENITSGLSYTGTLTNALGKPSITKGTDGALYASIADATDNMMVRCTATCTTATNWAVSEPASWSVGDDQTILVPMLSANIMFIWWDISASSNDLKYSVWGGSSWTAFANIATALDNSTYDASFGATIDRATGNVYLTYAQNAATLGTDDSIKTAVYSGGAWTAKTDVVTTSVCAGVSNCGVTGAKIARDETTGRIFAIYSALTTPATATTGNVYYKYSTDGMTTWSVESTNVNASADTTYGARVPVMGPRILITHYRATPDDLFSASIWPEVPGIAGALGKTTDGWAGAVPVYGTLTGGLSQGDYPYARAQVTTAASQTFYADMAWDSGHNRFEGVIYPGSNYCGGCDDPTYGTFNVTVQLDNNSDFSSVDYTGATSFTTVRTFKRSSMDNAASTNYTDFNPVWSTDHWHVTISDFGFAMQTGTGTNIAVAVPLLPTTASVSNIAVSFNGSSVSQGSAQTSGANAWWWESGSQTLYVQFASLTTTLVDVDISFDSDTDLHATRFNWVYTNDMGSRDFADGIIIFNQYLTAPIYGTPQSDCSGNECEGAGMQAETRAHEPGQPDESTDCMERVAVHVDDTARSDGTTYYQYDIKWKASEWASWITEQDNNHFTVVVNSDNTASTGWAQQLNNSIAAKRTQTFYAGKRYIKNFYEFTNNSASSHKYPMVWEREQWHGNDKQVNDHGRFYGQSSDVVMEQRVPMSSFVCPWQTAYDSGTYINMGVVYDKNDPADYGVFAVEAFLAASTYEWPISITASHATQTTDQTGFEKTWASVTPGQTVSFTFWHVHNAESSWANIESAMNADCNELNPTGGSLTADVVDASYAPVASPSMSMNPTTFNFACQAATGSFGTSTQQIYVSNSDAADNGWTLTLAATSPTSYWNGGAAGNYDFNDPTGSGCTDGADADSLKGQMTIDPSAATLSVGQCGSCTTGNISKGSSSAFSEGTVNSITLLSAAAASNDTGDWKLTGVSVSQKIPAEEPVGSYSINMTLTITAS